MYIVYIQYMYLYTYTHTRQVFFNWVLFHARKAVRHRENMRFSRSKLFGVYRELFRAIGNSLVALGLLEQRQVRVDTMHGCIKGTDCSIVSILRTLEIIEWVTLTVCLGWATMTVCRATNQLKHLGNSRSVLGKVL